MRILIGILLALMSSMTCAESVTGKVVSIADGDTLTILAERNTVKVRLAEIDAPEKNQAFGQKSKQSLSRMCFGKTASLNAVGKDRYGRTIAKVECNGIQVNREQVVLGMAWVYDRYATDNSLPPLQEAAKNDKRGLWADPNPTPPWEFRRKQGN